MLVDSDKMNQISVKQDRSNNTICNVFLIFLHIAEDIVTIESDFREQFDQQLKNLIT